MSEPRQVLYRGVPMTEGWPEKTRAAQQLRTYSLNGRAFPRIPYGTEQDDWGADKHACHDCRVVRGELHVPGCNGEECPLCGGQLLSCDCEFDALEAR
jgi:hypothetical protein